MAEEARPRPVGFVGLGNIGRPMALRLTGGATPLWVHDLDPGPVAELQRAGARVAAGPGELACLVDVLCVMVREDQQVHDVLADVLAGLAATPRRPGSAPLTVVVHSTVAPGTPAVLAEQAGRHGVLLVDAPVSGGAVGAADGSLAIMVGGSDEAYAACRSTLERMGTLVVHAGPIGAGTRMKLARNLVHFVSFAAVTEAQRLAEAGGLDLLALGQVVRHTDALTGGPGAIMHRATTAPPAADDFWLGVHEHVAALGEKDLGHAIELGDELGVTTPLARLALARLASGLGLSTTVEEEQP